MSIEEARENKSLSFSLYENENAVYINWFKASREHNEPRVINAVNAGCDDDEHRLHAPEISFDLLFIWE